MNQSKHHISGLMALLLFGVFAICILLVLLGATGIYQRLTERDARSYEARTAAMYVATKVRQNDKEGGVSVDRMGDADALVFSETMEGETFHTWVYCHDGYLYELFLPAGLEAAPEDGERLLPAESMTLSLQDGLLSAEITLPDGQVRQVCLSLRSGEVQP